MQDMTTIKIADTVHPLHLTRSQATSSGLYDGIYNMRGLSRASSMERRSTRLSEKDVEDDDPGLRQSGDYKQKQAGASSEVERPSANSSQVFSGKLLWWLAYQSIGVIYGDIGTSPLYVYSSTFTAPPNHEDLLGVLSIILWSLTMMVTVKYILIILRADNDGEGGTFSTYSLLSRYVSLHIRFPCQRWGLTCHRSTSQIVTLGKHLSSRCEGTYLATWRALDVSCGMASREASSSKPC